MPNRAHSPYARQKPPAGAQIDWGHPLAKGLVGLWVMNEGGGLSTRNLASGSLTRFGNSPVWRADSQYGNGIKFDGSSSYLENPYDANLNCLNGLTIEAIVRMGSATGCWIIMKAFNGAMGSPFADWGMYRAAIGGSPIDFRVGANDQTSSNTTNGALYHLVLTADGINKRWYVNGQLVNSVSAAVLPTNTNSQPVRIGANIVGSEVFDGTIFKAAIKNIAVSGAEVQQLYAEPYAMLRGPARSFGKVPA